jgi:hypothetical protein
LIRQAGVKGIGEAAQALISPMGWECRGWLKGIRQQVGKQGGAYIMFKYIL